MFELRVLDGLHAGSAVDVADILVRIGAQGDPDLLLLDPGVAALQLALVAVGDGGVAIVSAGDQTYDETGAPIQAGRLLQAGDMLVVAGLRLMLAMPDDPWPAPRPSPIGVEPDTSAEPGPPDGEAWGEQALPRGEPVAALASADAKHADPDVAPSDHDAAAIFAAASTMPAEDKGAEATDDPLAMTAPDAADTPPMPAAMVGTPHRVPPAFSGLFLQGMWVVLGMGACAAVLAIAIEAFGHRREDMAPLPRTGGLPSAETARAPEVKAAPSAAAPGARIGKVTTVVPLPTAEQVAARLTTMLRERDLRQITVETMGREVVLRGDVDEHEAEKMERLFDSFYMAFDTAIPITDATRTLNARLPFRLLQITGGPYGNVLTDSGVRLYIGDSAEGFKLVGIESGKVVFQGSQRVEVAW